MFTGRVTTEAVAAHEDLVVMWGELSADGVLTLTERETFVVALDAQGRRLMVLDIVCKWVVRTLRTGFSARKDKEMSTEFEEAIAA